MAVGRNFHPRCHRDILHLRSAFPSGSLNRGEVQLSLAGQALSPIYSPSKATFHEKSGLVVDTGRPVAHVAAEIGVGEQLLGRWVAAAKARSATDSPEVLDDDERAELQRLRKENAELRLDRAFLKKAAAFFASEQNR